jgi:hypothetical protein
MSTAKEQDRRRTTMSPAEAPRQEESWREDPTDPDEVGTAKNTTTVRGKNEPQSVRRSAKAMPRRTPA